MHVARYRAHGTRGARRVSGHDGTRGDAPAGLLRGRVFVDRLNVVRQGLRASTPSYSIKDIEHFYLGAREAAVKNAGVGAGFFGAAAVLLVFSLVFGFIALAEGLVTIGLWRWLAYLVVFLFMLVLIAIFVLMGVRKIKRVKAPQQTIETGKDTVAYLKANAKRS